MTDDGRPDPKRRKLRKGTHSCWGCKRRKIRCTYSTVPNHGDALTEADVQGAVCDGCWRRGTTCVSQDAPQGMAEEMPARRDRQTDGRMDRIEALVEVLVKKIDSTSASTGESQTIAGKTVSLQHCGDQHDDDSGTDGIQTHSQWGHQEDSSNGPPSYPDERRASPPTYEDDPPTYTTWFGHERVIEDEVPQSVAVPSTISSTSPAGTMATSVESSCGSAGGDTITKQYMDKYNGLIDAWPSPDDLGILAESLSATSPNKGRLAMISGPTSTVLAANNPPVVLHDARDLLVVPPAGTHLALVALKLLTIVLSLQHLDDVDPMQLARLHTPPGTRMQVAVDAATTLVVSQDGLMGSLEGVHCLVLVGIYQANRGCLRCAWLMVRKAMAMAQMMGMQRDGGADAPPLPCLDPATRSHVPPRCLWFRIVFADRYLSLMLGLPQGASGDQAVTCSSAEQRRRIDATLAQPVFGDDTAEARSLSAHVAETRQRLWQIEFRHAIIVGRILERNEAWRDDNELLPHKLDRDDDDTADRRLSTEAIDWALQKASQSMPSQWWQMPSVDEWEAHDGALGFLVTQRVVDQIFHYHLLAQLYLPFMLRHSPSGEDGSHAYSTITCASASREVLTRFLAVQHLRCGTVVCRSIDFFALLASMTLSLAHLDSHHEAPRTRQKPDIRTPNVLAHQRNSDRGMMERVLETLDDRARAHPDDLLALKTAALLRRILAIEEAASRMAVSVSAEAEALRIWVPYLGTIHLSHDGIRRVRGGGNQSHGQQPIAQLSAAVGNAVPALPLAVDHPVDTMAFQHNPYLSSTQSYDCTMQGVDLAFFQNMLVHCSLDDLILPESTSSQPLDVGLAKPDLLATDSVGTDAEARGSSGQAVTATWT